MKRAWTIPLILALGACSDDASNNNTNHSDDAKEVKKELGDTIDASKDYARKKRDEFTNWASTRLDELDAKIEDLGSKAKNSETMKSLKAQRDALTEKLNELKNSAPDAWEKAKGGFSEALDSMDKALEDALAELEEG